MEDGIWNGDSTSEKHEHLEGPVSATYTFLKKINSDQLSHEVAIFLAQTNVEYDTDLSLLSIDTVGDEVTITLSKELPSQAAIDALTQLVSDHTPSEEEAETLREYADNATALGAGLRIGDFYRTGEFVKIVYQAE